MDLRLSRVIRKVKNTVFWDVTPCGSCKKPVDGGAELLRNVGFCKSHTA
jgi:hypothetical protein